MSTLIGYVQQNSPRAISEGLEAMPKINRRGELCVIDFYTQMVQEGRAYQLRLGTITTPVTGDVLITDANAEAVIDAGAGLIIIPVEAQVDIEALGGTLPQVCVKAVGTVSTAGAAFVPLPLFLDDNNPKAASRSTARVAAAGGCTVTAEAATTTQQLYARTLATAALEEAIWRPTMPPFVGNDGCVYLQVGSVTTGSTYFAHMNWLEMLVSVID